MLLASSEYRLGILLNIPTIHKGAHTAKNYPAQKVNSAEAEWPCACLTAGDKVNTKFIPELCCSKNRRSKEAKIVWKVLFKLLWTQIPSEENTTLVEEPRRKVTRLKWRENKLYMEILSVGRKNNTQGKTWNVPKCEIGPVNAIYYTCWTASETQGLPYEVFFSFLFCIKQVLPRACLQGRQKQSNPQ